jgi:hypothetical protein
MAEYYSLPASSPAALKTYRQAVQATIHARSFTVEENGLRTLYQAPDRERINFGLEQEIIIGSTQYQTQTVGLNAPVQWSVAPAFSGEATQQIEELKLLLDAQSVVEKNGNFVAEETLPLSEYDPARPGQVLLVSTVRIHGGFVVRSSTVEHGFQIQAPSSCHRCVPISPIALTQSYEAIDATAPVKPPRANEVLRPHLVSSRLVGPLRIRIYVLHSQNSSTKLAGDEVTDKSGTVLDEGDDASLLEPDTAGACPLEQGDSHDGGHDSLNVGVFDISDKGVARVRAVSDGKVIDSMTPAKLGSGRFVVLVVQPASGRRVSVESLSTTGHVLCAERFLL